MKTEKYIPTEFTCTNYEYVTKQDVIHLHSELSFISNNNKTKYIKDSKKDSEYYKEISSFTYKNEPSSNFKINSNHYAKLDYFSIVDGVMIEDSRGFVFKIGNANFIQLARECTIRNGIIEDACVLGFDKHARVTLVKVGSSFYNEVVEYTSKQNYDFKEEDLVVGKVYRFKKEQNKAYVYLGKHKFKSKRDTYRFEGSVVQPKVPQHMFAFVYDDGSVSNRYTSAKISSVQEEVSLQVKTKMNNILTHFKNDWQGRVITSVSINPMTDEEKTKVSSLGSETYVVMKFLDGSLHLAKNNGRSFNYGNEYICPIDSSTYMPFMSKCMKAGGISTREEDSTINSPDNKWFNVHFTFEDPLSINF